MTGWRERSRSWEWILTAATQRYIELLTAHLKGAVSVDDSNL